MDKVTFEFDNGIAIDLILPGDQDDLRRHNMVKAVFIVAEDQQYVIYPDDSAIGFLGILQLFLQQALCGNKKINDTLEGDLGYLWNEDLHHVSIHPNPTEIDEWVGEEYLLWSRHGVSSWLYEKDGKMYFEVTPTYRWHFRDPEGEEKDTFISYEQFIENYKPYIVTELSTNTVREWLRQTERLLAIINTNDEKYIGDSNTDA